MNDLHLHESTTDGYARRNGFEVITHSPHAARARNSYRKGAIHVWMATGVGGLQWRSALHLGGGVYTAFRSYTSIKSAMRQSQDAPSTHQLRDILRFVSAIEPDERGNVVIYGDDEGGNPILDAIRSYIENPNFQETF